MVRLWLLTLVVLWSLSSVAQNPDRKRINHWYFGERAGLDFSSGTAVADTNGAMDVWKGSTTMSDTAGNLLFYSDGRYVWNAQHYTMPNGDILGMAADVFPMDAVIAVPKPGYDDIYYIFTTDGIRLNQQNGLQYHVVDMSLEGGLGDVVEKNIPLYMPVTEQLCAVRHANTCDYWLITHRKDNADYLAFQITAAGVDPDPVVSTTGLDPTPFTCPGCFYNGAIMMKASPQGDKLASLIHWQWQNTGHGDEIQLSSFDKASGLVSGAFSIQLDSSFGGFSFSPNGRVFYAEYGHSLAKFDQFDLEPFDSLSVAQSRMNLLSSTEVTFTSGLQIGNDGKVYGMDEWGWVLGIDSISVIQNPDVLGPGCLPQEYALSLNGRLPRQLMPLFVADFAAPQAPAYCSVGVSTLPGLQRPNLRYSADGLEIGPLPYGAFEWSINDASGRTCQRGRISASAGAIERFTLQELPVGYYQLVLRGRDGVAYRWSFVHLNP